MLLKKYKNIIKNISNMIILYRVNSVIKLFLNVNFKQALDDSKGDLKCKNRGYEHANLNFQY